jgi:hypothetical protein
VPRYRGPPLGSDGTAPQHVVQEWIDLVGAFRTTKGNDDNGVVVTGVGQLVVA